MFSLNKKLPNHLIQARKILVDVIYGDKKSSYSHDNIININTNEYLFDCSGLFRYILDLSNHRPALDEVFRYIKEIKSLDIAERIYTKDLFEFWDGIENKTIKSSKWHSVYNHNMVEVGDFMVWVDYNYNASFELSQGHIVFINKIIKKTSEFVHIEIIDSTSALHFNDTRADDGSGIGKGEIYLYFDKANRFTALKYKQKDPSLIKRDIRIARLAA